MDPIGQMVYNKNNNLIGWVYDTVTYRDGNKPSWYLVEYQDGIKRQINYTVYIQQLGWYNTLLKSVKSC